VPLKPPQPGRQYKKGHVRFYFDADVLGLAHVVANLRPDSTHPGDPGGVVHRRLRAAGPVVSPAVKDHVWIPEVAGLGWLIITRDARIRDHCAEIDAVRSSGARMVTLGGRDAGGTFDQLEILMCQWRSIEGCFAEAGPFIYVASRTAFRPVDLN
jgi:hypothetical protein